MDRHSKIICETCCQLLLSACSFTAIVKKNDQILRQRYGEDANELNLSNERVWPKPIQVDKSLPSSMYEDPMNIDIKQEVLSDDDNNFPTANGSYDASREDIPNLDIIKIEPEEMIQQQPLHIQVGVNGNVPQDHMNDKELHLTNGNCDNEEHLVAKVKEEPLSDEDDTDPTPSDLPLECMLCAKALNSVSGLKRKMNRGRFFINIIKEKYEVNTLKVNEQELETSINLEPQNEKVNRPINTIVPPKPCHHQHIESNAYILPSDKSLTDDIDPNLNRPSIDTASLSNNSNVQSIENDCNISSSEESLIDNSDTDPNYGRQKKKKRRTKVVPNLSSSSSSDSCLSQTTNSSVSYSSSSDSEMETRAIGDAVTQTQNRDIVKEDYYDLTYEKVKSGRKRLRKESARKSNICKVLRNSGKAYQSLSKTKKTIPERKVRPTCGEKCRLFCSRKIDEEARKNIFDAYWGLADLQRQREYIIRHTEEIRPKYRYSSTQNYRSLNRAFPFEVTGNKIRVCKAFFRATLDICDGTITTALSKKNASGIVAIDLRGKHGNQPKIDAQIKNSVVDFIQSIPRIKSHYLRAQTSREFICSDKSFADLYRDYKQDREYEQLPYVSKSTFNRIFNTELNISFLKPKKH